MASPVRIIPATLLSILWLGCTGEEKDTAPQDQVDTDTSVEEDSGVTEDTSAIPDTEDTLEFGECGDGEVNHPSEECDDGDGNANEPDACRTDCLLPQCGDGIQDSEEDCDDGNLFNVDGCSEECTIEEGVFETEPNNTPTTAVPLDSEGVIEGSLWEYDTDCYNLQFEHNDYVSLVINPEQAVCDALMSIEIYEDGVLVDTITALDDACTALDPQTEPSARYLPGSDVTDTTVCLRGFLGAAVEHYTLAWSTFPDSCTLTDLELTEEEDPDADLLANNCDSDDDNDGVSDTFDNCPVVPNNGLIEYTPTDGGFIRNWVLTSAFQVSGISTPNCQPLSDLFSIPETDIYPSLVNTLVDYNDDPVNWSLYNSPTDRIDFNDIPPLGNVAAPREVFAGIWVYSDTARVVDVKFGPDDGGKVWVNGSLAGETAVCQGASADKYTYPSSLNAGWNRVLVQVRDNGGGWAFYFRFNENGVPLTALQLSPIATGFFEDYQSDTDGDGIGDQCDLPD